MFLFCCVFDSVLQTIFSVLCRVDSKDCCCLFRRTALSHPKCLHSSTPTQMCERIMWLFSCAFSCIWCSITPSSLRRTHTQGTRVSKFCTPECWEQLLQETPSVLVSTHRSRFQSFHSKLVIKSVRLGIPS